MQLSIAGQRLVAANLPPSRLGVAQPREDVGPDASVVVEADATMTLCLPKSGMRAAAAVGELYLADISVPRSVTAALGPDAPDFSVGSTLRIGP